MTGEKAEKIRKGIEDKIRCNTVDMEEWAEFWGFTEEEYDEFLDIAIDSLPKEPKRGKWISAAEYCKHLAEETGERYQPSGVGNPVYCDQCWSGTIKKFDFCPNCGADMRGDE